MCSKVVRDPPRALGLGFQERTRCPGCSAEARLVLPNACIIGTGSYLPPRIVTNDDLATEFGIDTSDEWIIRRTGVRERRYADAGVATSDLAAAASRSALEDAGIEAADLDMIVACTLSPDRAFPGIGVTVAELLGLPDEARGRFVPAVDIRAQCSGFIYGLQHATALIRSGMADRVLLVGAEVHSAALDLSTRGRTVASLFGDGAAAVVLAADETRAGVRRVRLGADGRYADSLAQSIWDIRARPFVELDAEGRGVIPPEQLFAAMQGQQVFKHAVQRMPQVLREVCAEEGVSLDEIDLFVFHQANLRINQLVQRELGIDDARTIHNIQRYGNTTSATLPLLLDEASKTGRLKRGDLVAAVAFGSGFTWGAALLEW